jgi:hypothetical protein
MERILKYKYLIFIGLLFFASCSKDILDKTPLTEISEESVWNDPNLVQAFVNSRYNQIGHGWPESWQSSVVDESFLNASRGCEPITQGFVSPSDLGRMNGGWWGWDNRSWSTVWANISQCNLFFDRIEKVPFTDKDLKKRLKGEVFFIRALMYMDLVNRWGAMPLITKSYNLTSVSEISNVKRNTYKENIDFIVSQCDSAAALLPATFSGSNKGRATSVAALALKSRILLYAASPLMNKEGVNPVVGYTSPEANRWQKAADAAQAAINLATANGYALYDSYGDDVKTKYTRLFLDCGNSEVIFDREGGSSADGTNITYLDQSNGPNGYGQWGINSPTSEFVDAFEMADGSKFDWNNQEHKANPYKNRDPRLSAYVLSNGDPWMGRNVETYLYKDADGTEKGGSDTKYGQDNWNSSKTSYNVRKFLDESYVPNSWNFKNPKNWIWFRLGELYLNLAEANFNLGKEAEARAALNKIRNRARMPEITSSGSQLWDDIVYERRIELAFEEHRYFDTRRWLIAEDVLNKNATGVLIYKNSDGSFTYTPGQLVEARKFVAPKMYWLPIPKDEIDKNPNLEQNPGY